MRTKPRAEVLRSSKEVLNGVVGSCIWDGRYECSEGSEGTNVVNRCENVGDGGGAMKAMKNSLSPKPGDEGVTMMAGRSAFSSTSGSDRSMTTHSERVIRPLRQTVPRTQRCWDQRVVETLRQTVETGGYTGKVIAREEVASMSTRLPTLMHRKRGEKDSRARRIFEDDEL